MVLLQAQTTKMDLHAGKYCVRSASGNGRQNARTVCPNNQKLLFLPLYLSTYLGPLPRLASLKNISTHVSVSTSQTFVRRAGASPPSRCAGADFYFFLYTYVIWRCSLWSRRAPAQCTNANVKPAQSHPVTCQTLSLAWAPS